MYGSSIVSITIAGDGFVGNGDRLVTGALRKAGTNSFVATVTDSRGRTDTAHVEVAVTPYTPPSIEDIWQSRAMADGELSSQGTWAKVAVAYTYSAIGDNQPIVTIQYRAYGTADWTDGFYGALARGDATCCGNGNLSADKSYEIRVVVTDDIASTNAVRTIGTAYAYAYWDPEHNAIGFGARPAGSNRLQLSETWELYLGAKTVFDHLHPIGSVCLLAKGIVYDGTTYGTWVQIGSLTIGDEEVCAWKRVE